FRRVLFRSPERLMDADRIFDDAGDDRVPIVPGPIVENSVAAGEKVVAVALRDARGDDLRLRAGARAVAVGDIDLAHRRERIGPAHPDAELGRTAVDEKRARLENREPVRRI